MLKPDKVKVFELQQRAHSPHPACRNEVEIPIHRGWSVAEIPLIGAAACQRQVKVSERIKK